MKLAVRTTKVDVVLAQLVASLDLGKADFVVKPTQYIGITLLNLNEGVVSNLNSIRNIDALLLDEISAAELQQSPSTNEALFKSLDGVDEREQYEHLSQLLYIQRATRDKR
jgi:hypothetical protein